MFDKDSLEKWKKAVIHLDGITEDGNKRFREIVKLKKKVMNKEISQGEFKKRVNEVLKRISRSQGTAIFLEHKNKRYLLTARHVVHDKNKAKFKAENDTKNLDPAYFDNMIINQIFRVLSFDEMQAFLEVDHHVLNSDIPKFIPKYIPKSLFIGNVGPVEYRPYTFNNDLDLAIISLDRDDVNMKPGVNNHDINETFADELIEVGYKPISIKDISEEPTREGVKVFTVGFTGPVATFRRLKDLENFDQNLSPYYSLPNFSFGNVSMLHPQLSYFWVDMSIYPGNSGGPVIENNKLVGIVSGQAVLPEIINLRIPFGKIIKSKYIFDLIQRQEKSDKQRDEFNLKINEMLKKKDLK